MRASGAVMGMARASFGVGGVRVSGPVAVAGSPTGAGAGSGAAAQGFGAESGLLDDHIQTLGEHDQAGAEQAHDAMGAAGSGRDRMEAIVTAAIAEVTAMGASTNTVQGQRALVAAIRRRLEETKSTVQSANNDAQTRAASADVTAASYDGPGRGMAGAATPMPAAGMPMMVGSMPMMGAGMPSMGSGSAMGSMAGGAMPLAPLAGLMSMIRPQHSASDSDSAQDARMASRLSEGSPAAAIATSDVRFDRLNLPQGRDAYRSYIAQALDTMGITDPAARANWIRGLEVGAERESGFNNNAVNRWDSNARGAIMADGAPAQASRGGLQTIPSTFAAHHHPGTSTNIYDPVANAAAAINYLMRRYHVQRDGSNLSAVPQFNPNHAPQGY